MMRASALLFAMKPAAVLDVLRLLQRAGFFAEPPPLDELDALFTASVASAPPASDVAEQHRYARLLAPADLPEPHRAAAQELFGRLERAADERAPYDPFEVVVPIDADRDGARRAKRWRGARAIAVEGSPRVSWLRPSRGAPGDFAPEALAELRVFEESVPYVAFLLERAGAPPAFIASLDDD